MKIDVPRSITRFLPTKPKLRRNKILDWIVMGAYSEERISRGRACELLSLNYWEGEKFFAKHGLYAIVLIPLTPVA